MAARIFEHAGHPFDDRSRRAALDWLDAHPSRPHPYDAARFGLTADTIRERFREYVGRFDVRLES